MGYRVTFRPTGQQCVVESHETVLDAAVRAGIALEYGCSNGNCGLCKAKVIEGHTKRMRHHEFVIPELEKAQGVGLLCTITATTDLVIEASVADRAEDIAVQSFRAKVRKLSKISEQLMILTLKTPRTHRLRFIAGQFATLGVPDVGTLDVSIASCPCDDLRLEFHIRRVDDEPFSEYVFEHLKMGSWIDIEAPKGEFIFRDDFSRPLILIAFDTGFAAIKSLLEHATAQDDDRSQHLIWIACSPEGQYLSNLCRSWQDALDEFQYTPVVIPMSIKELAHSGADALGSVDQQLREILRSYKDLASFDVYVAAPEPMLETVKNVVIAQGLPSSRFSAEPVHGNQNIRCLLSANVN